MSLGLNEIVGSASGGMPGAGGGYSASSSASASQESANQVSSGGISIGGLNMAPKSILDSDLIVKGAVVCALVLGGVFLFRKIKK